MSEETKLADPLKVDVEVNLDLVFVPNHGVSKVHRWPYCSATKFDEQVPDERVRRALLAHLHLVREDDRLHVGEWKIPEYTELINKFYSEDKGYKGPPPATFVNEGTTYEMRLVLTHTETLEVLHDCLTITGDGVQWGISDWYEELEEQIAAALAQGPEHRWTTTWYGSKKEFWSGCVTQANGTILAEGSVSDDFDQAGKGEVSIPFTTNLNLIRAALDKSIDLAQIDQVENQHVQGFKVIRMDDEGRTHWVDTYIGPHSDTAVMFMEDGPPGDNYHKWGFQEETDEMPDAVKTAAQEYIDKWVWPTWRTPAIAYKDFNAESEDSWLDDDKRWKIRPFNIL